MHAVVEAGGKQYRVAVGDTVRVERMEAEPGQEVWLDRVLLLGSTAGEAKIGSPALDGVRVRAEVVAQGRGKKILVFKYKPKVNYRRRQGHRQAFTQLKVTAIEGEQAAALAAAEASANPLEEAPAASAASTDAAVVAAGAAPVALELPSSPAAEAVKAPKTPRARASTRAKVAEAEAAPDATDASAAAPAKPRTRRAPKATAEPEGEDS